MDHLINVAVLVSSLPLAWIFWHRPEIWDQAWAPRSSAARVVLWGITVTMIGNGVGVEFFDFKARILGTPLLQWCMLMALLYLWARTLYLLRHALQ